MKRIILAVSLILLPLVGFSQATKPTIMVVPSDQWCNANGFLQEYDNQGVVEYIPNYQAALVKNENLIPVVSQINGLMADRGFPLKNLESEIKSINQRSAEMAAVQSRDGASIQSNPLMMLRQRARADIIIQISWNVNTVGPKRSITYTMQGLDSYTNKEIATSTGTGAPSFTVEPALLLSEAISAHIDEFCDRLQNYFDDLFTNGREVALSIQVFDNDEGIDLESEFDGIELREIIENWVSDNTVAHRYHLADDSELYMSFDEVRIPLYDENGRPISANNIARQLSKFLRSEPYMIPVKTMNQGLGLASLIIGDK